MKTILIDIPPHPAFLQELQQLPEAHVILNHETCVEDEQIHLFFGDTVPEVALNSPVLEFVQLGSVGYSQLYGHNLPQRGVQVSNARGVFDPTIAEWNIAMMINLLRDVPALFRNQQKGHWEREARFQRELRGLTVGIWGYGGIGRATARLAKSFGLKVHVLVRGGIKARPDIYLVPETGDPDGLLPNQIFTADQEEEFLSQLDFLIVAVPQTPGTTGMIGEKQLRALPACAFVLNPARGPIIEEQALLRALEEGWIAGAALDTHYYYPMPPEHRLWKFPNVIMTPHISGSTSSPFYLDRVWEIFVMNVKRILKGEALVNEVAAKELTT